MTDLKQQLWELYTDRPERLNNPCFACRTEISAFTFVLGYVTPKHLGGKDTVGNLRPLCRACKNACGRKNLIEWMISREYLLYCLECYSGATHGYFCKKHHHLLNSSITYSPTSENWHLMKREQLRKGRYSESKPIIYEELPIRRSQKDTFGIRDTSGIKDTFGIRDTSSIKDYIYNLFGYFNHEEEVSKKPENLFGCVFPTRETNKISKEQTLSDSDDVEEETNSDDAEEETTSDSDDAEETIVNDSDCKQQTNSDELKDNELVYYWYLRNNRYSNYIPMLVKVYDYTDDDYTFTANMFFQEHIFDGKLCSFYSYDFTLDNVAKMNVEMFKKISDQNIINYLVSNNLVA